MNRRQNDPVPLLASPGTKLAPLLERDPVPIRGKGYRTRHPPKYPSARFTPSNSSRRIRFSHIFVHYDVLPGSARDAFAGAGAVGKRVRMYSFVLSGGSRTVPGPLRTKNS
jgi:hypothetical protein